MNIVKLNFRHHSMERQFHSVEIQNNIEFFTVIELAGNKGGAIIELAQVVIRSG